MWVPEHKSEPSEIIMHNPLSSKQGDIKFSYYGF